MSFNPKSDQVQAGVSLFQKDDNFITYTIEKEGENYILKLVLKEKNKLPIIIKADSIPSYDGSIIFRVTSDNKTYKYLFSINDGKKIYFFLLKLMQMLFYVKVTPDHIVAYSQHLMESMLQNMLIMTG